MEKFISVFSIHRRSLGPCSAIVRLMPQIRCVVRALKLPLVLGSDSLTCQFWPKRLAAHGRNLSVCLLLAVFCVEASARHGFRVIACTPGVHAMQRYALSWGQRAECKFLISALCPLMVKIIGAMPCALRKFVLELSTCCFVVSVTRHPRLCVVQRSWNCMCSGP